MARFLFSMQNILEMKEKLETQAKNEYAQANARLLQEQEKLQILQNRLEDNNACLKGKLQEKLTVLVIRKLEQNSEILEKYIELQKKCNRSMRSGSGAGKKKTDGGNERA